MRYGSVCSGIEAATVAWDSLGWTPQWFSEIEPFPSAVLAHHYPTVPNFGDMTKFKEWTLDDSTAIDVLVGGTPCQSFSVAGLRKGLEDPRGNLMLTYLAIANKYRPKWLVWENVAGVLSSNGGNDFASFLRGMGELGYGFAYRVLDAQYFGVAQRRRRVFVVGCLGDWRSAAAVLFERHSLSGHPAPSREKRQEVAGTIGARTGRSIGAQDAACGHMISWPPEIAPTLNAHFGDKQGLENQHINGGGGMFTLQPIPIHDQATRHAGKHGDKQDGKGNGLGIGQPGDPMNTLTKGDRHAVAQPFSIMPMNSGKDYKTRETDVAQPLMAGGPVGGNQGGDFIVQPIAYNFAPGAGEFKDDIYITTTNISRTIDTSGSNPAKHQGGTGVVQPVAYAFDSLSSNSMKSSNPDSGVNQVDVSKTLDTSRGLDPSCNQGGIGVVQSVSACDVADTLTVDANQMTGFIGDVVTHPIVLMDQGGSVMNVLEDGTVGTLRRETHGHEPVVMAFSGQMSNPQVDIDMTQTLGAKNPMAVAYAFDALSSNSMKSSNPNSGVNQVDVAKTLDTSRGLDPSCNQGGIGIVQNAYSIREDAKANTFSATPLDVSTCLGLLRPSVQSHHAQTFVAATMAVRRLTPVECEALQGFPKNYTNIPWRKKEESPDGPRYKALGNSMAVPVMAWIGKRIADAP